MQNGGRYVKESTSYVNIHGKDVRVFRCEDTNALLVPIDDVKDMGFRLFLKSQYSRLLVDQSTFTNEFNLWLMGEAESYLLERMLRVTSEDIRDCVNGAMELLTNSHGAPNSHIETNNASGHKTPPRAKSPSQTFPKRSPVNVTKNSPTPNKTPGDRSPNNFMQKHTVKESADSITITTNLRQPRAPVGQNNHHEKNNFDQNRGRNSLDQNKRRSNFDQPKQNNLEPRKSPNFKSSSDSLNASVNTEEVEILPCHELTKPNHTVIITHINPHGIWVQDAENSDVLLEINAQINKEVKQAAPVARVAWGKIYLGQDPSDENWYRCKIIKFKPTIVAFFVDYGNDVPTEISKLREASEELCRHPLQAIKVVFNSSSQEKPKENECVNVRVLKKYEKGTYLLDITDSPSEKMSAAPKADVPRAAASAKPVAVTFFTKPPPFCELENGQRVMIIGHVGGRIALRTKECYESLKQIERALEAEGAKKIRKVQKGQLVLCKRHKMERAVVIDFQNNRAEVEFLDYCETANVDFSYLRHINEDLAKKPMTYLMTPPIRGYSGAADALLAELGEKKAKGTVILSGGEVDLKLGEELLSQKIRPGDRPMFEDFTQRSVPLGLAEYTLNAYSNQDVCYFGSMELVEEYLEVVCKTEVDDEDPYEPVEGEVCLGCYQDSWSRCVVLGIANLKYTVRFIDFGNEEALGSKDLRKLPAECRAAPVLAFRCRLTGYPQGAEARLNAEMKENEEKEFAVDVKRLNGTVYEVEVPQVYDKLA